MNKPLIVVGAIIEQDGKILFCQQAEYKGEDAFKWGPPAGKWDGDESIIEGAIREVKEETGYDFVPESIVGLYSRVREYPDVTQNVLRVIFRGKISGQQTELAHDIVEARWFSVNELMNMDDDTIRTPEAKVMIQDYLDGQNISLSCLSIYSKRKL